MSFLGRRFGGACWRDRLLLRVGGRGLVLGGFGVGFGCLLRFEMRRRHLGEAGHSCLVVTEFPGVLGPEQVLVRKSVGLRMFVVLPIAQSGSPFAVERPAHLSSMAEQ